jgi:hypothetical protein
MLCGLVATLSHEFEERILERIMDFEVAPV